MNKFTKLLSVFVIAGAIGTGIAGVSGCKKGNGGNGEHTDHNWTYSDIKDDTHDKTCSVGGETVDDEAHVWGTDGKCVCGKEKPADPIPATSVTITGEKNVNIGESIELKAEVTPGNSTEKVVWSIVNGDDCATIDESGIVTGIKRGMVTVRATAGNVHADYDLTVREIKLENVTLDKKVVQLKPNEEFILTPTFTPENASNKKIIWTVADDKVATVDENGVLKGVADGETTINGTIGSFKLTCKVEVNSTFVDVKYEVNITDKFAIDKVEADRRSSFVTVGANTEVRGRTKSMVYENKEDGALVSEAMYESSVKLGATGDAIKLTIPAAGLLKFHAQNGSSGTTAWQQLVLTKPNGSTEIIRVSAHNGSPIREVVLELETEGEYTITRTGGTTDIYYLSYECRVKDTPLEKIEFVGANTEFYVGQQFDYSQLVLNKVYSITGRTEALAGNDDGVTVDYSAVDMTTSGKYIVNVIYNDGENDYRTSYEVIVYGVDKIELGRDKTVKESANSSAGNGVYANHHLRELYFEGDKLNTDGMTVILSTSIGEGQNKVTQEFIVEKGYVLTMDGEAVPETLSRGKHVVTVTWGSTTIAEEFEIYVIAGIADLSAATSVSVKVDASIADNQVGVIKDETYQFKTIHQALEFLENCSIPASASKVMSIAAGEYNEKLEIRIPNLTIIGAGSDVDGTHTLIEWDSLVGVKDAGGFVHTTDSTATFNVRDSATGFAMRNVVVSNFFNSADRFNETLGEGYSEHRALAMLVQADKVVVENCTLLGYQDTLELFTGRHVFRNCLIEGVTDFIFGTNGTTYFTGCEIRAIKHVKEGQVGYYTAFKGNNKGSGTDKVTYGAIFDDCDFTAEDGVANGWAIGRAWGADAAVMVMNSRLGGHIAKDSSRYVSMGNGEPQNAQFTEYGNSAISTGNDGSLDTPVQAGGKNLWSVPSEADAAKYAEFATIFGMTNGLVKYADVWNGEAGAKITTETYNFAEVAIGSTETVAEHFAGKLEWTGTGRWNGNSIQVSTDTVIKLAKAGAVTITWFDGYGSDSDAEITYDAEGKATIKIVSSGRYIVNITVNMAIVPEASKNCAVSVYIMGEGEPTLLSTINKPEGNVINKSVLTALITGDSYAGLEIDKIYASDRTTEYTFGPIVEDTSIYITLKESKVIFQIGQTADLTNTSNYQVASGSTGATQGVQIDCTAGTAKFNGRGGDVQLGVGTVLTLEIQKGADIAIEWYNADQPQYGSDANAIIQRTDGETTTVVTIIIQAADGVVGGNAGSIYLKKINVIAKAD